MIKTKLKFFVPRIQKSSKLKSSNLRLTTRYYTRESYENIVNKLPQFKTKPNEMREYLLARRRKRHCCRGEAPGGKTCLYVKSASLSVSSLCLQCRVRGSKCEAHVGVRGGPQDASDARPLYYFSENFIHRTLIIPLFPTHPT